MLKYGVAEELAVPLKLKAGALSLDYAHGFVRYIKIGDTEVLRMINHLVRDQNWNTIPQVIEDEIIEQGNDRFRINYKCRVTQDPVDFLWECEIEGTPEGKIRFSINGKALTAFKRNRIGFTVLHPNRECCGQPATIYHSDGTSEELEFPRLISPHQPFMDITAMQWNAGGARARLKFSGEVFETEDQRNWTDDSYKTYCTPLALPFPKQLQVGDRVSQEIKLSLTNIPTTQSTQSAAQSPLPKAPGAPQKAPDSQPEASSTPLNVPGTLAPTPSLITPSTRLMAFEVIPDSFSLPRIGICRSSEVEHLSNQQVELLKNLKFDHYQVDLLLSNNDWKPVLTGAVEEATSMGSAVELSLFFTNASREVEEFIEVASSFSNAVEGINIFDHQSAYTSSTTLSATVTKLKAAFSHASIGAGTNAFFTELNRNRVEHPGLNHLVYSINPQVHAFDNASLVESLYAQPDTVDTAYNFSGGKPVRISPVTLKMRWNPNATETGSTDPMEGVDTRQMALFGACWLLGSLQNLVRTNLQAVTYFETVGMKGIMQSDQPLAEMPGAPAGAIYPMYFVLRYLLKRKELPFRPIRASDPLKLGGLMIGDRELILANYTNEEITVTLPTDWHHSKGSYIDTDNVWDFMTSGLNIESLETHSLASMVNLAPYALALLEK